MDNLFETQHLVFLMDIFSKINTKYRFLIVENLCVNSGNLSTFVEFWCGQLLWWINFRLFFLQKSSDLLLIGVTVEGDVRKW